MVDKHENVTKPSGASAQPDDELIGRVERVRRQIVHQGDPLLFLQIDQVFFIPSIKRKMQTCTEVLQGVKWRDSNNKRSEDA